MSSNKTSAKAIFVTGTDTNVGKTFCAAAIAAYLKQQGKSVAYVKPIETGCKDDLSSDQKFVGKFIEDTYCFYKLKTPISPHLAAKQVGLKISITEIKKSIIELSLKYDYLVIEGAGGLLVQLTDEYDFSNLVEELNLNLILVAGSRLGVLNQARLNFEYIRAKNLKILGYVLNQAIKDNQQEALKTNRDALAAIARKYEISELFSLPFFELSPDAKTIIEFVDKSSFSAKIRPAF